MKVLASLLLLGAFSLSASLSNAQVNFGSEVTVPAKAIYKNLTYAYDVDWAWGLTVETSPKLSNSTLSTQKMVWSVMNSETKQYLFGWMQFQNNSPVFSVNVSSPAEVSAILKVQKEAIVVVAQPNGSPEYFLELGKFCSAYPSSVKNLTETDAKACEVNELPDSGAECKEYGDWLSGLVKQGLLTCVLAEKQYAKGGGATHPGAINCEPRTFCGN